MKYDIWIKNNALTTKTYGGQDILVGEYYQIQDHQLVKWQNTSNLLADIGIGDAIVCSVNSTSGEILDVAKGINFLKGIDTSPRLVDGRVVVHETSRKSDLTTNFTGADDSQVDGSKVAGGSNVLAKSYVPSDPPTDTVYFDLNTIDNESEVYKGRLEYKDALNDLLTVEVVPKVTTVTSGTSTLYNLYGGYLIIPAAGDGTTVVADEDRVLVEVPRNAEGELSGAGYWNATWNTTTKVFDAITPAPLGDGQFNMFSVEVILDRFINKVPILGDNDLPLPSQDVQTIGHNLRFKITIEASDGVQRTWHWNAHFLLHRKKTA